MYFIRRYFPFLKRFVLYRWNLTYSYIEELLLNYKVITFVLFFLENT